VNFRGEQAEGAKGGIGPQQRIFPPKPGIPFSFRFACTFRQGIKHGKPGGPGAGCFFPGNGGTPDGGGGAAFDEEGIFPSWQGRRPVGPWGGKPFRPQIGEVSSAFTAPASALLGVPVSDRRTAILCSTTVQTPGRAKGQMGLSGPGATTAPALANFGFPTLSPAAGSRRGSRPKEMAKAARALNVWISGPGGGARGGGISRFLPAPRRRHQGPVWSSRPAQMGSRSSGTC